MSNRTYICIDCRSAKRAEAAYGLINDFRCSECQGPLWELEWRWRIPKKTDDKGWRDLASKVEKESADWLPRRERWGIHLVEKINCQIAEVEKQKESEKKGKKLKSLLHQRREIERKYTEHLDA